MTAKQLRAKLIEQIVAGNTDAAKMLLMQYETQLCLEQREICGAIYYHQTNDIQRDLLSNIENAPMPEL